ncbi:hypothetical protein P692DRAFT_20868403 [Suillus brevipes Sb2]|nr:hypothetical protein P692DRAFT_20868403 [Suillus brevipes Sb2]
MSFWEAVIAHPGAHCIFTDGHTGFNRSPQAKPITAATKVKKARKGPHASPSQQNEPHDEVMSPPQTIRPPPSRPFIVVPKPPLRPAPPPLHPPVMGTKPVMLDVISIPTSDSKEEPLVKPETEYEGKTGKKTRGRQSSPLMVNSSSDEPLIPAVQPAKRLHDGLILQIINGFQYVEGQAHSKGCHEVEDAYDTKKILAVTLIASAPVVANNADGLSVLVDLL